MEAGQPRLPEEGKFMVVARNLARRHRGAGEAYARFRAVLPHKVWEFYGIRGFEDDLPAETLESFDC